MLRNYIQFFLYLYVFIGYSLSYGGSYEDFFIAVKQDNADVVRNLIQRGFDSNTVDTNGQFPIILALREPSLNVVSALLEDASLQIEVRTENDESPLMLAAFKGLAPQCEQLIARGADVNKPGWAPLHYAATGGHTLVVQILLDNHAYIDAASPNGSTPLMMAAMYGTTSVTKLLLEAGADPMLKNELGLSAIDFALRAKKLDSADVIAAFVRGRKPSGVW
jgi:ankyrin repeat protein